MIISDRHGYAFIRLHRTGSTSVSRHLNDFEDEWSDLVEQIASREDLEMVAGKPVDPYHVPHSLAKKFVPEIESYFKFSFVRNPWDRFVSAWKNLQRDTPDNGHRITCSFTTFIENLELEVKTGKLMTWQYLTMPQSEFIGSVDFIGRFENIENDLHSICEILKLPQKPLKKQNSTKRNSYSSYYTEKTKNIVNELYKEDIEKFNYAFEK